MGLLDFISEPARLVQETGCTWEEAETIWRKTFEPDSNVIYVEFRKPQTVTDGDLVG